MSVPPFVSHASFGSAVSSSAEKAGADSIPRLRGGAVAGLRACSVVAGSSFAWSLPIT